MNRDRCLKIHDALQIAAARLSREKKSLLFMRKHELKKQTRRSSSIISQISGTLIYIKCVIPLGLVEISPN